MGKVFGGITDAIGLTDHKGEKKAAQAASAANAQAVAMSKEQIELAKEQLDFQKEQYQDWNNIYGDIQKNLGDYYENLSPDKLVAMGLQNQQREFQQVSTAIKRDMAQRGLSNSGLDVNANVVAGLQNATARAAIRTNAQQMANEQKMGFLGIGLGQGTQMLGQINNAAANVTSSFSNAVNSRTSAANNYLNRQNNLTALNMDSNQQMFGMALGKMGF